MEHQSANKSSDGKAAEANQRSPQPSHLSAQPQLQQALGNRALGRYIQAKLTVSQPGDQYEQEADQVADQVMRMPDPSHSETNPPTELSSAPDTLQRACAKCGDEDDEAKELQRTELPAVSPLPARSHVQRACTKCSEERDQYPERDEDKQDQHLQAKSTPGATGPAPSVEAAVDSISGGGEALSESTRAFFEPRLGYDFSLARIHTNGPAAAAASAVSARAYTVGSDIVFGSGEYAPSTSEGRRLLAHELVHVMQQTSGDSSLRRTPSFYSHASKSGHEKATLPPLMRIMPTAARVVQRAATDFRITQIDPQDAANPSMIFFEEGSSALTPGSTEHNKIAALALPASRHLTLNGFSSEEGSAASNDAIVTARMAAVSAALLAAGHSSAASRTPVNLRTSGIGQINYRHARAVEVLPTPLGLASAPSGQNACAAVGAEIAPCGTAVTASWPIASTTMITANAKLANAADPDAPGLLTRLFSGVPRATVVTRMTDLGTQVNGLLGNHRCHTNCDAGCGRPAYNDPPAGAVGGQMTVCPEFLDPGADPNWRARVLIHESAHGTPAFGAEDIAYANTRQIAFLTPADQLRNTDSYMLLAWLLAHPGTVPIGPATPDVLVGMLPAEQDAARRAVAWVESWLNYGDFDTETLYATVNRSIPPAPAWDTSQTGDDFNRGNMHLLSPIFGWTDPGTVAPFTQPTSADKVKVAAIHDRFDQMYSSVNWQILTVTKGVAGSDAWGGTGASLPRLTQSVTVGPAFFGMSTVDQIKHLVLLMATAMFGISAPFRPKYPQALDILRTQRGIGP